MTHETPHGERHRHVMAYFARSKIDILARFKVVEFACACNSNALVRPVTLQETSGDLPLHSIADAFVVELPRTRQTYNRNNNLPQLTSLTSVTLLLLFKNSAIRRPLSSLKRFALCITRRHMLSQPPKHPVGFTTTLHACKP